MDSEERTSSPEPEQETEMTQQPQQLNLRTCIRCKSTTNLFKNKVQKTCINCLESKPKRERSEKQLEAFAKARESRLANISRRKATIDEFEQQAKEDLDKRIVKKAISIKKKQIKQTAELDQVSDDDTPLEEVIKIAKKRAPRIQRAKSTDVEDYAEYRQPMVQFETQYQAPKFNFC